MALQDLEENQPVLLSDRTMQVRRRGGLAFRLLQALPDQLGLAHDAPLGPGAAYCRKTATRRRRASASVIPGVIRWRCKACRTSLGTCLSRRLSSLSWGRHQLMVRVQAM